MAKSTKQNVENQSDSSEQEVKDILGKVRETLGDEKFAEIISSYGANSDDMNFSNVLNFARNIKVQLRNLKDAEANLVFSRFSKSELIKALESPNSANNQKKLREISNYLYNASNYYKRLILYYSNMPTWAYYVSPYDLPTTKVSKKDFLVQYKKLLAYLENLNIRHEFQKILNICFKQDIFYGITHETPDSFYVQELDPEYCKVDSVEDGVYGFSFDNAYFDKYKSKLEYFDPLFKSNYDEYLKNKRGNKWFEIPSDRSICIKVNEEVPFPIPPFVSLLPSLADIDDYKALSKAATESNNYRALSLKIPISPKDGTPLVGWKKAKEFYDAVLNVVPENIGVILTPMDIDSWDFQKQGATQDTSMVSKAEAAFWAEACTNSQLFGGETTSSAAVSLSMQTDQTIVFGVLRQFERWVNLRIKKRSGKYKFKAVFLDQTHHNKDEVYKKYLDMGRYGLPVRNAIMAAMGISPASTVDMAYLENEILDLVNKEVPLKSSNTQSSDAKTGRPQQEVVDTEGEKTRNSGSNETAGDA